MASLNLNNARLHEGPLPSQQYNNLPHIDDMRDAAANHAKAHATLLGLIASHGLADKFSIHLVHKHFDIPEGRIMVYETVPQTSSHETFVLCSPRRPGPMVGFRGLYFKADAKGEMTAYEYTTAPGSDLSGHEDFVAAFADALVRFGVQDVFALTAHSICAKDKVLTEFELAYVLSTILVYDATWLPAQDAVASTSTDWLATDDYAQYANGDVPGIVQLKCLETRAGHYNVTCSRTRNGSHLGRAPDPFSGEPAQDMLVELNGQAVEHGSKSHAIVTHALERIDLA